MYFEGFAEEAATGRRTARIGQQTLFLGDVEDVLNTMERGSVDTVVTSPPYNLGIRYSTHRDDEPRDQYLEWMGKVAVALRRVLSPSGSLFLNVGASNSDPWVAYDVANAFRKHFTLQNDIKWIKSITVDGVSRGHFKPVNSQRFVHHNHETIFHFSVDGTSKIDRLAIGVPYADKSNISRRGHSQDLRCDGNVWFIPYKTVRSKSQKFDHPAGFPLELPLRCIKLAGGRGVVLDPFVGTGTTCVAAQQLGLQGIGIDVDRTYLNTAYARLKATPLA